MTAAPLNGNGLQLSNGDHAPISADHDPFTDSPSQSQQPQQSRYSAFFDPESLSLDANSSPSHLRRTLQAHLLETDRRLQETQRLGTSLLHQQQELADKLTQVEAQDEGAEVAPELRKRLAELEQEYNEVGREIARAIPKGRAVSGEDRTGPESTGLYSSQATSSPSKVSVPSRRQRTQPTSRAGDIQFAADISTSLLAQVRQLQAALSERDESLKSVNLERARLEHEAQGFSQRLRALDDSEQRYKDENWNLETRQHELLTASQEAADREKRLNAGLAAALAEKNRAQTQLEELTVAHEQLGDEHTNTRKAHDSEVHALRKTVDSSDAERISMMDKIEELTAQNQELAKGMAARQRGRAPEGEGVALAEDDDLLRDLGTPEHSPPPSPTKATPRHGGLESETLKSSLHHAHRMIQNLKGNIHREKTEKIELKRMLQDARDELEQRRGSEGGLNSGSKRQKTRPETFKKPLRPDMLGGGRAPRTDVELEDQDWEDHAGANSPSQAAATRHLGTGLGAATGAEASEAYLTANDSENAFETANEREATESDDFETGAESLAGESTDELTETEGGMERTNTVRGPPRALGNRAAGDRSSMQSTASTSAGEDASFRASVQAQPQKYRLKNGKTGAFFRQSHNQATSTPESVHARTTVNDSPVTIAEGRSPPLDEQSLFAELGEFNESGIDTRFGTPARGSVYSHRSTPSGAVSGLRQSVVSPQHTALSAPVMVDSGMMTEPWEPEQSSKGPVGSAAEAAGAAAAAVAGLATGFALPRHQDQLEASPSNYPLPVSTQTSPTRVDLGTQYTPQKGLQDSPIRSMPNFITPPKTVWDEAHNQEQTETPAAPLPAPPAKSAQVLSLSGIMAQHTMPTSPSISRAAALPVTQRFSYSGIHAKETEPSIVPHHYSNAKVGGIAGAGVLASVGAALGLSKSTETGGPIIAEDETRENEARPDSDTLAKRTPLTAVSGNERSHKDVQTEMPGLENSLQKTISSHQSVQTMLTGDQIDRALQPRAQDAPRTPVQSSAQPFPTAAAAAVPLPITPRAASRSRDKYRAADVSGAPLAPSTSPYPRPGSAHSQRPPSANITSHPPLPQNHRTNIAKAGGRVHSPIGDQQNSSHVSSLMGPPIAPASAYNRPKTPAEQSISAGSPIRGGTTPRPSHRGQNRTGSQMSRRSSVSSFASELDERFNIRTDGGVQQHQPFEAGPGTDPRMIQAITQTMIGEFLWKYTRKPGRPDMSNTRHKRYFWVHPYTRTLYWSDQDPQTAGRSELKAKSVAIESVRVVTDDNPMPPGLHRKSLEVITPGRKVKFTASTGQRHETWFNALSYLLLRSQEDANTQGQDGGLTTEDVNEFNPSFGRGLNSSRMSMSSYNSRTTHGTTRAALQAGVVSTASRRQQSQDRLSQIRSQEAEASGTVRKNSNASRLSRMLGSMSTSGRGRGAGTSESRAGVGNTNGTGQQGSIYNASIVSGGGRDSAEELRQEMLRQEREGGGRLENVRACCDGETLSPLLHVVAGHVANNRFPTGKHDVSTLAARGGRHHHHHHQESQAGPSTLRARTSQSLDRLTASVSRRPVGTLTGANATAVARNA